MEEIFASLPIVDRYQRFLKEWNQVARIRSVKAKAFKEAADFLGTSSSTIIRRFKELIKTMQNSVQLPEVIVIDQYKADTDVGEISIDYCQCRNP